MMFPTEPIPDNALFAPHHYLSGIYAALVVAAIVWDNDRYEEPLAYAVALLVSLFGWAHVWKYYPQTGATLALGGVIAAFGALWNLPFWREYPRKRIIATVALLVALDDLLSHAFGIWTPLDWMWNAHLYHLIA